ncbi:MAG: pilus assembly protein [Gammaproteobacteria bacterium]
MNKIKHTMQSYLSAFSILALTFAPGVQQAMAAPGTISQVPLYVGPSVEPNVVFVADDSGSMDWGLMTPEGDGIMYLGGNDYYYSQPEAGPSTLDWYWVTPSEEYMINVKGVAAPAQGVWRAWSHHYNTLYYNPSVTYSPWAGLNSSGNPYGNASPTAARVNPYSSSSSTVDLTKKNTSYASDYPGFTSFTVTNFYPARYYTWTDSDSDGVVDPEDAHTLVEITNVTTNMTASPPSSYTGSANRTDCAAAPVCTYAEEIQNFANWFSYYRKRELTTKAAISLSAAGITGVRMGYATINNNNSVKIKVASMNLDPTTGNKKKLYEKLFKSDSSGGTPLQTELRDTGKYFECKSGNIMGVSGSSCPILPSSQGGQCQKNFAILMTDGFYNGSSPSLSPSNSDGDDNTDFDGDSYGDSESNTLADVAMHYYERDLSTSLANDVPVWEDSVDQARHQHMNTFTVAFGVNGTLDPFDTKTPGDATDTDPTAAGFEWPDPDNGDAEKIDDLWHTAYNGRGQFYSAQDATTLASGLADAFASVTRGTSSSSAVAFNTTTLDTGSRVYQATFNPSDNWHGDLLAFELSMDGSISETPAWHASDVLDAMVPAERKIFTYNETTKQGIAFKTLSDLSTKQQNDLNTSPAGTADGLGQARLDYLRGVRTDEDAGNFFRERTNVLGDIVYSNPVYVGPPQSGYSDDPAFGGGTYAGFNPSRAPVIYVGSNDGMLHGFRESDGQEVFAYVPNMLFSNAAGEGLHYLTDPAYGHRYYVDLSPTVADVYLNSSWKTVLIGGYRAGARGLFALDVTDPDGIVDADANSSVLWEFTSNDDNSLGHSFSKPTMALMENDKWAAVFGNGYNDQGDGQAKLFILYMDEGMDRTWGSGDYKVITTGVGSAGDRNGLSTPALVDTDGNGKADRVYAGDLKGNLWAFDLSDPDNDATWGVAYGKALFNASEPAGTPQPITAKPVVARNPATSLTIDNTPNILVFFGTGQYMVNGDKTDTSTQTFYGVWDNNDVGSGSTLTRTNLVEQELDGSSTADIRVVTDNDVSYSSKYGWYFDLPTSGERVVVDPKIRGEYVFFNTLIPDPNTCNTQGYGWLMALRMVNGGEPNSPVFDINNDGHVDENDQVGEDDNLKNPSGVRLDGIPAGSNFLEDYMYTPDDDGDIDVRKIDAGDEGTRGRLSWREVSQ